MHPVAYISQQIIPAQCISKIFVGVNIKLHHKDIYIITKSKEMISQIIFVSSLRQFIIPWPKKVE